MRRQIRNVLLVITAFLLTVLFCFFPNIQSRLTDWKTFGKSENLSLNPVEISVESTQTTLEKLKIINNHILSVSVRPSSRTVDGRDVEKTARKQINQLFEKMKISYRVNSDWKVTYKKLYTYITKQNNTTTTGTETSVSNVNMIMDAYTDQILAIDVYSYEYTQNWKDIAKHIEDIPSGFLSYLNLKQSEFGLKKNLLGNASVLQQYEKAKSAKNPYTKISGSGGVYAIQNKNQTYIPVEWSGYGFMINNVYNN